MQAITLNPSELQKYRYACAQDSENDGPALAAHQAYFAMLDVLQARNINGDPEKVTVQFVGEGCPNLYELHYSETI